MIRAKFILSNYANTRFIKTGRKSGNATYFYKNDKQYMITRETNYVYGKYPDNSIKMYLENDGTNTFHSHEALYEIVNNEANFVKYLTYSIDRDCGFEDPRCVTWNNVTYLMTNRRNLSNFNNVQMHIGVIDDNLEYINDTILKSYNTIEKNWQPITDKPGICIYAHDELALIDVFNNVKLQDKFAKSAVLCGSSQIVKVNDKYISVCHVRNEVFEYLHYFVMYDEHMNILEISDPFSFYGANVEFNNHLEYSDNTYKLIVSIHDQILYEFTLTEVLMSDIFKHVCDNCTQRINTFTEFYNNALCNNNEFAALGFATFSKDKSIIADAAVRDSIIAHFRYPYQNIFRQVMLQHYKEL